jgi:hypothetical protein
MKRLSVLWVLFFVVCLCYTVEAQGRLPRLFIISLNQDSASLATPSEANLVPGDTLQFVAVNADFDIMIEGAYKFLQIKEDDLKVKLSSIGVAESEKYIVRKVDGIENKYSIYCISCSSWPDAPPRIIIVSQ